ncbi:MAG: hypothetical protein E7001_07615 [Coriobacteriaceae bacterium]|nr:hypothetical protein [Coriobacteriaceae bacterium]
MARRESNIDPFNAGEPVLPWDEPSQVLEEREPAGGYRAPEEVPDAYRPPHPQQGRGRRGRAGRSRRTATPSGAAGGAGEPAPKARMGCGGCLIVGLIILAIWLLITEGWRVGVLMDTLIAEEPPTVLEGVAGSDSQVSPDDFDEDAERGRVREEMTAFLDGMAESDQVVEAVSSQFAERVESALGYSADELGIDINAFLTWAFEGSSYEITGIYVYSPYDGIPAEAYAYFDVTARDTFQLIEELLDRTLPYFHEQGIDAFVGTSTLSDEQRAAVAQLFEETLASVTSTEVYKSASLQFVLKDGAWEPDVSAAAEQLGYALV